MAKLAATARCVTTMRANLIVAMKEGLPPYNSPSSRIMNRFWPPTSKISSAAVGVTVVSNVTRVGA